MHEDVIRYLRRVPPFRFMPRAALRALAFRAQVAFLPEGELADCAPQADRSAAAMLHVVVKGVVAACVPGVVPPREVLGPGDVFGWTGNGAACPAVYRVASDALCYLLPEDAVRNALEGRPDLREMLEPGFGPALFEHAATALARQAAVGLHMERPWQVATAAEAMPSGFASAPVSIGLGDAARRMTERQRSAIVLLDEAGRAAGILTDRDFRARVVACGTDHASPASAFMSSPVQCVQAGDACLDVMLLMAGRSIHHVVVLEGEEPVGVLSLHDLMVLRGVSPSALAGRIGAAGTLTELVEAAPRVDALAASLLGEGARPATLRTTLPELHDRMTARLFHLGIAALGPPPCRWCFLVFGPAARRESVLRHRQWNGLVHDGGGENTGGANGPNHSAVHSTDHSGAGATSPVAAYFDTLARFVRDGLRALGFAPCPQGRMAATPGWTLSLDGWRNRLQGLALDEAAGPPGNECGGYGAPDAMPLSVRRGMFDVRPVCGDLQLGTRVVAAADEALALAARSGVSWLLPGEANGGAVSPACLREELTAVARWLTAGSGGRSPGTADRLALCGGLSAAADWARALADARRFGEYLLLREAHAVLGPADDAAQEEVCGPSACAPSHAGPCGGPATIASGMPNPPYAPDAPDAPDEFVTLVLRRGHAALRRLRGMAVQWPGVPPAASCVDAPAAITDTPPRTPTDIPPHASTDSPPHTSGANGTAHRGGRT